MFLTLITLCISFQSLIINLKSLCAFKVLNQYKKFSCVSSTVTFNVRIYALRGSGNLSTGFQQISITPIQSTTRTKNSTTMTDGLRHTLRKNAYSTIRRINYTGPQKKKVVCAGVLTIPIPCILS